MTNYKVIREPSGRWYMKRVRPVVSKAAQDRIKKKKEEDMNVHQFYEIEEMMKAQQKNK